MSGRAGLARRLQSGHRRKQVGIVGLAINAVVNTPVAIWTKRNDEVRIVWSAVTHTSDMVRLKVRRAIGADEWGRASAALTIASGAGHHIISHVFAAFEYRSRGSALADLGARCAHGSGAKCGKVCRRCGSRGGSSILDALEWLELKHIGVSLIAVSVGRSHCTMCLIDIFVEKPQPIFGLAKQKQALAIRRMIADGNVALDHLHVANLAFAKIFKSSVFPELIGIAVSQTFGAGDDDDEWMPDRRDDAALLLAAESSVNVSAPIIDPVPFEAKRHPALSSSNSNLLDFHSYRRANPSACTNAVLGLSVSSLSASGEVRQ